MRAFPRKREKQGRAGAGAQELQGGASPADG